MRELTSKKPEYIAFTEAIELVVKKLHFDNEEDANKNLLEAERKFRKYNKARELLLDDAKGRRNNPWRGVRNTGIGDYEFISPDFLDREIFITLHGEMSIVPPTFTANISPLEAKEEKNNWPNTPRWNYVQVKRIVVEDVLEKLSPKLTLARGTDRTKLKNVLVPILGDLAKKHDASKNTSWYMKEIEALMESPAFIQRHGAYKFEKRFFYDVRKEAKNRGLISENMTKPPPARRQA